MAKMRGFLVDLWFGLGCLGSGEVHWGVGGVLEWAKCVREWNEGPGVV